MSLINDALAQIGKETAAPSCPVTPPGIVFRGESNPVSSTGSSISRSNLLILAAAIIFLTAGSLGFLWIRAHKTSLTWSKWTAQLPPAISKYFPVDQIKTKPVQAKAFAGNATPAKPSIPSSSAAPAEKAITPLAPAAPSVAHASASNNLIPRMLSMFSHITSGKHSEEDEFKLQAIVYCPGNSSAVINGQMAFVGERVANAKVCAIGPGSVRLLCSNGRTNLLELRQ